jgi:hypothetical protein
MLSDGALRTIGFVRQEEIGLADFLANRFGSAYAVGEAAAPLRAPLAAVA